MRILEAGSYRRTAWRNGLGETAEIAVGPEGADFATFDWRISQAGVVSDGPFSLFPDVDRTLVIAQGGGLRLQAAGGLPFEITCAGGPVGFPADVVHTATLLDGPVQDLNIMTRRGRASHEVAVLTPADLAFLAPGDSLHFLVCLAGWLDLRDDSLRLRGETWRLGHDTLRLRDKTWRGRLQTGYTLAFEKASPAGLAVSAAAAQTTLASIRIRVLR